ncbi:MAG: hypothetical protein K2X55_29860 [Burkholderiaceae bacterium]|nr:hypothetical protein [Burkholderiaceae bacterium]MBY0243517.1 hypothetical protein [Burkholderiaceae bacterium]
MRYIVTIRTGPTPSDVQTYPAIGDRDALQDAAYDAGALGVSIVVRK